jgi:hypothetical protein
MLRGVTVTSAGGTARRVRNVFRTLLALAIVGTCVVSILATFGAFSNEDAFGRVEIPGHKVLHFPAGAVDIAFDTTVNNSGTRAGFGLTVPSLTVGVHPVGGGPHPSIKKDQGASITVNGDAHERVWRMQIQRAGEYHVSARGRVGEYVSPQLMFGTETSVASVALPGGLVIAAMLLASLFAGSIAKRSGDGRRR